jgi:hypothetical protein
MPREVPTRQTQEVAIMNHPDEAALVNYPHGRGYGHDYMRGGEVLGGYGYAERDEYAKPRGELTGDASNDADSGEPTKGDDSQIDTGT